ncbi:MAG: hypothetical protein AB8I08_37745 [Sandaracinaceae bacterium]
MTKPTLLFAILAMLAFPLGASAQFAPPGGGAEIGAFFANRPLTPDTPRPSPRCTPDAPGLGALGLPAGCATPTQPVAPDPRIERSMPPGEIVFGMGAGEPTSSGGAAVETPTVVVVGPGAVSTLPAPPPTVVSRPAVEATTFLPTTPSTVVAAPLGEATVLPPPPRTASVVHDTLPGFEASPPARVAVSPAPVSWPTASAEVELPPAPVAVSPKGPASDAVEVCPWTGNVTVTPRQAPRNERSSSSTRGSAQASFTASASFSFSFGR